MKQISDYSFLDHLLEGCQIIGFDWRFLYINDAAAKHNRRPKEELLGKKYTDIWPGIQATEVFGIIKRCMKERIAHQMENEFIFPDGTKGRFSLSIQPIPEGVFILSIYITKHKLVEDTLRQNEQRLSSIYDTVGDVIFYLEVEVEEHYRFISVNPAFCRVTGLPKEAVIGKRVDEVIPESSLSTVLEKYRQAIKEKIIVHWHECAHVPSSCATLSFRFMPSIGDQIQLKWYPIYKVESL